MEAMMPRHTAHNLPARLTSFVGRERERADLAATVATARLVTLVGAPGVGKTRLGLQIAAGALDRFADGVWLVELAPLADSGLVPQAVVDVFGVRERPGRTATAALADWLQSRSLLLLIDNCEHLVGAVAALAETLLHACPGLHVLATSREPLAIDGEVVRRVPSLTVPDVDWIRSEVPGASERAASAESVRLFVERACAADARFALTDRNVSAVAQICARLDGIPLALELAAARVRALSVEQIAARLDDRFRLLTGGSRTALARQQTLRGAVDWSYDLLSEPEKLLLRRLSVFAGGFTLQAAEGVCAGDVLPATEIVSLLVALVDKSVVQAEETLADSQRYRLLETLKQYGRERLAEGGELALLRGRHRDYFVSSVEQLKSGLFGPTMPEVKHQLEREQDELRAALAWCLEDGVDSHDERRDGQPYDASAAATEAGLRLASAMIRFWFVRSNQREGRHWLEQLLLRAMPLDTPIRKKSRAEALHGLAMFSANQGDYRLSIPLLEEALEICRELGDDAKLAAVSGRLGQYLGFLGEHERAAVCCDDGLARARQIGDPRILIDVLMSWGSAACCRGDFQRGMGAAEECVALCRETGDISWLSYGLRLVSWAARASGQRDRAHAAALESLQVSETLGSPRAVADSHNNLGGAALLDGDALQAIELYRAALAIFQEHGDRWGLGSCVGGLARACVLLGTTRRSVSLGTPSASRRGDSVVSVDTADVSIRAARLFGLMQALRESLGVTRTSWNQPDLDEDLATLRARLGVSAVTAAWDEGQRIPMHQAAEYALATTGPVVSVASGRPTETLPSTTDLVAPQLAQLTPREREVAALIAGGRSNRQIAGELVLSERTAETHVHNILGKLGLASRAQLAVWAVEYGLRSQAERRAPSS
jgi:predicted ATPase/DNA-binding CsgD family transcriptional regulator